RVLVMNFSFCTLRKEVWVASRSQLKATPVEGVAGSAPPRPGGAFWGGGALGAQAGLFQDAVGDDVDVAAEAVPPGDAEADRGLGRQSLARAVLLGIRVDAEHLRPLEARDLRQHRQVRPLRPLAHEAAEVEVESRLLVRPHQGD